MQQGWVSQAPIRGSTGPMMGQGRMVPNMNPSLPARGGSGPPGSRAMVNMQMMANGSFLKRLSTAPVKTSQ